MQNLSFEYPIFLLIPILFLICLLFCKTKAKEVKVSTLKFLQSGYKRYAFSKVLIFLIVLFLSIALASPIKNKTTTTYKKSYEILLALDVSASMQEDNRFLIAKKVLKNFIKKRKGDNIGLIVFANEALIASAITNDKNSLLKVLEKLNLGVAGSLDTSIYEALYLGAKLFNKSAKEKVLILLTDGINTTNVIPLDIAKESLKKQNVTLFTIGVGKSSDYNKDILQSLSSYLGGEFFSTTNPQGLEEIYSKIDSLKQNNALKEYITNISYYYKYFVIIAIVLIVFYFLINKEIDKFLLVSIIVLIASLLNLNNGKKDIKSRFSEVSIILDISQTMLAKDVYPNRLEFAKFQIKKLIDKCNGAFEILAQNNKTYLISPKTANKEGLKLLINKLNINIVPSSLEFNLLNALKQSNSKNIVVFSSFYKIKNLKKIQNYINRHNINLIAYSLATKKGSVIKINNNLLLDKDEKIVFSKYKDLELKAKFLDYKSPIECDNFKSAIYELKEANSSFYIYIAFALVLIFISLFRVRR